MSIEYTCKDCGGALEVSSTIEDYNHNVAIEMYCPDCEASNTSLREDFDDLTESLKESEVDLQSAYEEVEKFEAIIESKDKQIEELRDFIDGYIDSD